MAIAPVSRLKKSEIVWLGSHRCKHGHTYLEHFSCYLAECPDRGKVGFFDIETTSGFDANYGVMLCYCIKELDGNILGRCITKKEVRSDDLDKAVIKQCIKDLARFDIIVTYYGTRFDLPYVRSRAVHQGLEFPAYGEIVHNDLYYVIRNKFKLHRNSLEVACRFLLNNTEKTHVSFKNWIKATQGDSKALKYVYQHCEYDVKDLEKLYKKVMPYKKRMDTSA